MNLLQAILQGVLEGLTEFIPVSSTGHLILLANFLGEHGDKEKLFEVFIQLGAILSVGVLYLKKLSLLAKDGVESLTKEGIKGIFKKTATRNLNYDVIDIALACLPPLVAGYLFYKPIKSLLFYPVPVACALIFGGILLIFVEKLRGCSLSVTDVDSGENLADIEHITRVQALLIGFFQCLSLWPGMSRSGSCIIGGRLLGLSRVLSAEFSFIVALPIMCMAVGYDVYKSYKFIEIQDLTLFVLGFVLAFISGAIAVKAFISYLSRYSLVPFGIYRVILGITVLWYFW
ncbi:MAG TPA: undecaprenyl-diphosphate phosphatase [Oligoflexia bacterium]|nr:undecaprenyl-diphosphate phosphatase [Oligoflexia bacterium]HMP48052.1 undecaprenyl-diphosphate phosphatase [Oligoflexia bacterium]